MAKKQKLTQNQRRRINHNQFKKQNEIKTDIKMLQDAQRGLVIRRQAKTADVLLDSGEVLSCNIRRNLSVVVNDYVHCRKGADNLQGISGVIEAIFERKNELSRPDYFDGVKTIASNLDLIVIVSAILPEFSTNIIDRYLVICEKANIPVLIVLNKSDLFDEIDEVKRLEILDNLQTYQNIGYQTFCISSKNSENIDRLQERLQGNVIVVGQSGVGKSSIVNAILPKTKAQVGAISENSQLGQHTTTVAERFDLPNGALIDSPGIREFGLWHLENDDITQGYIEFQEFLGGCKFRDCKHLNDPGCLLKQAVEEGKISQIRFENYHKLIQSVSETREKRNFKTFI